jgi:hypothetical protein
VFPHMGPSANYANVSVAAGLVGQARVRNHDVYLENLNQPVVRQYQD